MLKCWTVCAGRGITAKKTTATTGMKNGPGLKDKLLVRFMI